MTGRLATAALCAEISVDALTFCDALTFSEAATEISVDALTFCDPLTFSDAGTGNEISFGKEASISVDALTFCDALTFSDAATGNGGVFIWEDLAIGKRGDASHVVMT